MKTTIFGVVGHFDGAGALEWADIADAGGRDRVENHLTDHVAVEKAAAAKKETFDIVARVFLVKLVQRSAA
jgi:hypothetical protein